MGRETARAGRGTGEAAPSAVREEPVSRGGTRRAAEGLLRRATAGEEPGPHLLILSGPEAGARFSLGAEQVLGRGTGADLRIADPTASRLHARVRIAPSDASVEDLGSKNGLAVNGRRIRGACRLAPGDEIALGATTLAFSDPLAGETRSAVRAAPPSPPEGTAPGSLPWLVAAVLLGLCALALALAG